MRTCLLLAISLFTLSSTQFAGAEPKGRVLKYGMFHRADKEQVVQTPGAPSGVTRLPVGYLSIETITNRIPAKVGVQFGIRYEIADSTWRNGQLVEITKVMTHPPMKKPDGQMAESFSFAERSVVRDGRIEAQTGYGFDHDYELVPGLWRIQIEVNGRPVLTQEFTVFGG